MAVLRIVVAACQLIRVQRAIVRSWPTAAGLEGRAPLARTSQQPESDSLLFSAQYNVKTAVSVILNPDTRTRSFSASSSGLSIG